MTEEEREELERLQLELLRYEKGEIKREKAKRKLGLAYLISIVTVIIAMILALTIIPRITKSITVDTNGDGFYETKRVFIWQVDDYEEYMYKSPW